MTQVPTIHPLPWHRPDFERLLAGRARLAHALLLHGPRGIGKLEFARALALALLCEEPTREGYACTRCPACAWFRAESHPDWREVQPLVTEKRTEDEEVETKTASVITVEQIRLLADFLNVSSHRGRAKVILVHPAEALNPQAANAVLKGLEEPPPGTYFLLVTHRPQQLLATIKSRCRHVALAVPDLASAGAWLASEGVPQPELALAHTGCAPLLARELARSSYWSSRAAFMRVLAARELDVFAAGEALRDHALPDVLAWLQKWSYDLARCQAGCSVRFNPDYREAIARVAEQTGRLATLRFHREMVRLQRVAHHPLNARLFLEHVLLAYRDLFVSHPASA
jgi:DNA polymerase III subunit delta'